MQVNLIHWHNIRSTSGLGLSHKTYIGYIWPSWSAHAEITSSGNKKWSSEGFSLLHSKVVQAVFFIPILNRHIPVCILTRSKEQIHQTYRP